MTKVQYDSLSDRDKIFAQILLEIEKGIRSLREDISEDIKAEGMKIQ